MQATHDPIDPCDFSSIKAARVFKKVNQNVPPTPQATTNLFRTAERVISVY